MAIYHLHVDSYRRSRGRTAIGGAAYRRGLKASCPESGKRFNFRAKGEVAFSEFIPAKNDRTDYSKLPNLLKLYEAIERAEKHPRATLGREIEAALPHELALPQQVELVRAFIADVRKRVGAEKAFFDFSIHAKKGNEHVHIAMSEREQLAPLTFSKAKRRDWDGEGFVSICREVWQTQTNAALKKAGVNQQVDRRSHADRGSKLLPALHEGRAAYFDSEVKKMNQVIKQKNLEIQAAEDEKLARKARVDQLLQPMPQQEQAPCGMVCVDPSTAKPFTVLLAEQHYRELFAFSGLVSHVNLRDPRKAVILFKDRSKIIDSGNRVACFNTTPEESAQRVVALAKEKCWGAVSFFGDEAFLRAAFSLAFEHGLTIVPKDAAQQNILESLRGGAVSAAAVVAPPVAPHTPFPAMRQKSLGELAARIEKRREEASPTNKRKRGLGS